MKKIVLIDGHSILNRAFYGVPDLTDGKGRHTNAVYGFLNILFKVLDEEQPDYLTVAFDVKEKTFRHEKYKEYKGTRKPMPEQLHMQVPIIQDVLGAMNICVVTRPGYEADDILGTISEKASDMGYNTVIISGDRDLLQLVTDKVKLRIPKTRGGKTVVEDYDPDTVKEVYNLTPKQIIDLKGLMGDSSDNIPGLPGVGEKTAVKLLTEYESVENVIAHAEDIKPDKARRAVTEHKELAILSKELATIKTDCELDYDINDAAIDDMFNEDAYHLIKELEFKSMLTRFADAAAQHDEYIECEHIRDKDGISRKVRAMCESVIRDDVYLAAYIMRDDDNVYGVVLDCVGNMPVVAEGSGTVREVFTSIKESDARLVLYNLKDQLDILDTEYTPYIFDAHLAAYLINPLKGSYDGCDIARDHLGRETPMYSELFGKKTVKDAFENSKDEYIRYCLMQCRILRDAFPKLIESLKEDDMYELYTDIEMPLIYVLYDMENEGISVDKEALYEYGRSLDNGIRKLEEEIYEYAGEGFNINSPKQLGVILFEKLKLPFAKKTKTGYSTSADILQKLRYEDPIIPAVLSYRTLTKLKSTYADGLSEYIGEDGRIHGKFNQTKTATGRISSLEPNLQNIPIRMELGRKIRKVFVPREGCVFIDADYSQIELRVLAHMSADKSLIEAYNEGRDIHSITASKVFHVPLSEVSDELRRKAKAVNFGIIYGISSFGLSQDLDIGRKEADDYIKRYFETYPTIKDFLDKMVSDAKEKGYTITEYKRRRPVPELASGNFMQRSFGERVAMNAPIQGTAADIIKIAMIRVSERLRKEGLDTRLILQVHDELLLEAPACEAEKASAILKEEMMRAADMSVVMDVEVKCGSDWYEAH